jgi:hypothetical protein
MVRAGSCRIKEMRAGTFKMRSNRRTRLTRFPHIAIHPTLPRPGTLRMHPCAATKSTSQLVELASKTPVGKTWVLDRSKVMVDLAITDAGFEDLQRQIEARMPGKCDKATGTARRLYVYLRLA